MKLSKIFSIIYILFIAFALLNCGGDEEEQQPESIIFSNVKEIELLGPNDGDSIGNTDEFSYYIPTDVTYAVLGIFSNEIETYGNTFVNAEDLVAGSRTGLSGWTTEGVPANQLYIFDNIDDFDSSTVFNSDGTYYWAVWGYDKNQELTHASTQRQITISY